jgi:hypothetical protein
MTGSSEILKRGAKRLVQIWANAKPLKFKNEK